MDIKELTKIVALCKKNGVEHIKIDNLELRFDLTYSSKQSPNIKTRTSNAPIHSPGGITEDSKIETQELSEEQLLFYSVNAHAQ